VWYKVCGVRRTACGAGRCPVACCVVGVKRVHSHGALGTQHLTHCAPCARHTAQRALCPCTPHTLHTTDLHEPAQRCRGGGGGAHLDIGSSLELLPQSIPGLWPFGRPHFVSSHLIPPLEVDPSHSQNTEPRLGCCSD